MHLVRYVNDLGLNHTRMNLASILLYFRFSVSFVEELKKYVKWIVVNNLIILLCFICVKKFDYWAGYTNKCFIRRSECQLNRI